MKIEQLTAGGDNCRRAILFFAGWSIEPGMMELNPVSGYDTLMVWDYTDMTLDKSALGHYDEIIVVAWSYGVAMASICLKDSQLPITRRVAVNGTLYPVDETRGIAPQIFQGTLNGLNRQTLSKFDRRMCGSAAVAHSLTRRCRTLAELKRELEAIGSRALEVSDSDWDEAFVSKADMIVPTSAQLLAWSLKPATRVTLVEGAHLTDFNQIFASVTVDKSLIKQRFTAALGSYDSNAGVQRHVADTLATLVLPHLSPCARLLEIGSGTGMLTNLLVANGNFRLKTIDLVETPIAGVESIVGDAEIMPGLAAGCDAVVSASALQWFNSPRRYLKSVAGFLKSGAIVAIAVYGSDNFKQIDSLCPARRRFPSLNEWKAVFPTELELIDVREETIDVEFDTTLDVLRHLKATGVNGTRDVISPHRFMSDFPLAGGKPVLTYNPIWIVSQRR